MATKTISIHTSVKDVTIMLTPDNINDEISIHTSVKDVTASKRIHIFAQLAVYVARTGSYRT